MKSLGKAIKDKENTINKLIEEIKRDDERREKLQTDLDVAEENMSCVRKELETVNYSRCPTNLLLFNLAVTGQIVKQASSCEVKVLDEMKGQGPWRDERLRIIARL